ncbi:MAG TPA: beta-propeller fold lactonase family protein [Solirubrobacteraceae bacterium]
MGSRSGRGAGRQRLGGARHSGPHASGSAGHVYVNDNSAGGNTVAAFDRAADGALTPIAGSPFAAGGLGLGKGIPSQGATQLSSDGRFVLVTDAGSNQISVLAIGPEGALAPVGPPVASGGVEPVSIAVSDDLVYVANAGAGGTNVTGFRLNPQGALHRLANSTVSLPEESGPGDVLFNSDGRKLAVTLIGSSTIVSFAVHPDGRLVEAPGSPFAAQGLGPFGAEFRPTDPSQLYVSNAHGGAGNGTVSAFEVSRSGELTSIGASPFADGQTAPCWVEISHDGQFLFTTNTASGTISRYSIAADGTLTLLGSTEFGTAGGGAVDLRLSPDGGTLFVNGSKAGVVASFAVSGGDLTQLASSPTALPVGAFAAGIVVD